MDEITARARRRTATIVAAVVTLAAVAGAAVAGGVALLPHATARPGAQARGPAVPAPGVSGAVAGAAAAADDLSWTTVVGARVPVSRSAGPRDMTGGRARGFSPTPVGAMLAAAHVTLRLGPQVGPAVFEATLREQVVGDDAAALAQQVADDYEKARARLSLPYGQPAGKLSSNLRGYRVAMDSPTNATVALLIEGPAASGGTALVEVTVHMRWVNQDWAVVAPAGGDWIADSRLITDTTGYTTFPGQG